MDTSLMPLGPTVNSLPELSYSSGGSRTSTRSASPDTSSASHRSSPLLDLHHHLTTTNIDIEQHVSNTLLDPQLQPKMDRNSFNSCNERRAKLTTDRNTNINTSHLQQQQSQTMTPTASALRSTGGLIGSPLAPPLPTAPRSLTSANWRSQSLMNQEMYSPFDITPSRCSGGGGDGHISPLHPTSFPSSNFHHHQHHGQGRLVDHSGITSFPNLATFSDMQLEATYAYCYDRGNGQYTRLIPADALPPLRDIPALQQGCSGMVVLPQPRSLPPNGHSSNAEHVMLRTPPTTPTTPADTIQTRIDTIVASTPPTPTHAHHPSTVKNSNQSTTLVVPSSGGHSSRNGPTLGPVSLQRRPKIFCDKWVHEGVCAFTQQGCKYKHEMPLDKFTQHQLGLFHGLPAWWKKHQAELNRQRGDVGGAAEGEDAECGRAQQAQSQSRCGQDMRLSAERDRIGSGGGGAMGGVGLVETGAATGPGNMVGGLPVSNGGSSTGGGMAWKRPDNQGLAEMNTPGLEGMSRALGGVGSPTVGARNSMISYGSPFGPIAPPTRAPTQQVSHSPTRSIPTSNPYASLEALYESTSTAATASTSDKKDDGARLG